MFFNVNEMFSIKKPIYNDLIYLFNDSTKLISPSCTSNAMGSFFYTFLLLFPFSCHDVFPAISCKRYELKGAWEKNGIRFMQIYQNMGALAGVIQVISHASDK